MGLSNTTGIGLLSLILDIILFFFFMFSKYLYNKYVTNPNTTKENNKLSLKQGYNVLYIQSNIKLFELFLATYTLFI